MKEILLNKLLDTRDLNSRITVKWLFEMIKNYPSDAIILNFAKIRFISRSAAHQLLIEIRESKFRDEFKNMNRELQEMIDKVGNSNRRIAKNAALAADTYSTF